MSDRLRVLIVEDTEDDRNLISRTLAELCDARVVATEAEFEKARLEDSSWDLLVVDWVLSGPNGEYPANKLAQRVLEGNVPLLILTGAAEEHPDVLKFASEENADYIDKGDLHQLEDYIRGRQFTRQGTDDSRRADLGRVNSKWIELVEKPKRILAETELFWSALGELTAQIVDERCDWERFRENAVCFVANFFECKAVALVWFGDGGEAILGVEEQSPVRLQPVGDGWVAVAPRLIVRRILASELARPYKIKRFLDGVSGDSVRVMEDYHADVSSPIRNTAQLGIASKGTFAALPIVDASEAKDRARALVGAILLFRESDRPFDAEELEKLKSAPLAAMLVMARAMPFRLVNGRGIIGRILSIPFALTSVRPWTALAFVFGSIVEAVRVGLVAIGILMAALPISVLWRRRATLLHFEADGNAAIEILHSIDLLVMTFTGFLLSIGLLALAFPAYTSRYSAGLPPWMFRFAHVDALKRTILALIAILVSIGMLERLLSVSTSDLNVTTAFALMQYGVAGFLTIAAMALYVRLALPYSEEGES